MDNGSDGGGAREAVLSVSFWNTQGMSADGRSGAASGPAAAAVERKRGWLEGQLDAAQPVVLVLIEVQGRESRWSSMRRWLSARGYAADFKQGVGGRNGVVVAVRKEAGKLESVERICERVVGFTWRATADGVLRRTVALHGQSSESPAGCFDADGTVNGYCFAMQLAGAQEWLQGSGGIICGDFNRVVCCAWRKAGDGLMGDDDRRLRQVAGWRCACCDAGEFSAAHGVVGGAAAGGGSEVGWTRWHTSGGRRIRPTSRIDYAVAVGKERSSGWRAVAASEAVLGSLAVSDHDMQTIEKRVVLRRADGLQRPVPVPLSKTAGARALFAAMTAGSTDFAALVAEAVDEEVAGGGAPVAAVVRWLVETGWTAVREARGREGDERRDGPLHRYHMWRRRLKELVQGRRDRTPWAVLLQSGAWAGFKGGFAACIFDSSAETRLLRRCRKEVHDAGRLLCKIRREGDEELRRAARDYSAKAEDAATRMQKTWRAIRERSASNKLDAVWRGDVRTADGRGRLLSTDAEFKSELGRIGDRCVEQLADTPACLPAYEAWLEVFQQRWDVLRGVQADDFDLATELTWEVFQEVLGVMPKGKAVGAGGFTCELLRAAGEVAQRAFYDALIHGVREGVVPKEWSTVIYALLAKPPPNDPELVGERREIALMAHDLKVLMQMVRRVSYQRIAPRLSSAQMGWLAGHGCPDVSSVLATVIQQAKAQRREAYLLYIDLSQMFPRLDRGVVRLSEVWMGLPDEVARLAQKIYGQEGDWEGAVECRYDSSVGLGAPFKNPMGALMGDVLSPDKAKLVLHSVLIAIEQVCKGVRLWGS